MLLAESTGLSHRKPGEVFKGKDGSEIYFQSIQFYPQEGGKYTTEQLGQAVEQVTAKLGQIAWVNKPNTRMGGFGIATFETDQGELLHFGRYFQDIKSYTINNFWANNDLLGYHYTSKTSSKAKSGLMPQDILTQLNDLTADQIVEQIAAKLGNDHPLTALANRVTAGMPLPISIPVPANSSFTGFRDYFCELLHPIALQRGLVAGNADEAEEIFLGDGGFNSCVISFGSAKTEGLSDSIFTNSDGHSIRVSSKGGSGGGAKASVKNLIDAVDELTVAGNTKLKNKHKETIAMIRAIQAAGQKEAPLMLAVKHGIINQAEANQVSDLEMLENKNIINYATVLHTNYLSARLKRLYAARNTKNANKASAYYHMMAAIAFRVEYVINTKTNFSEAAAEILNNRALVQVHTSAIERENEWVLKSFTATFPSSETTGVILQAQKSYYSTGIKGHFTFKILKNGEKYDPKEYDDGDDSDDAVVDIAPDTVDVTTSKSDLKAADAARQASAAGVGQLGRRRR